MISKILDFFISMKMMASMILLFAISIATATFIENDFGTTASKAVVYNTTWFETIMFLLLINLIGNIYRYRLYKLKKWSVFMFHFAFILMVIGAGITRYISYEGIMHIREGKQSSLLQTDKAYLQIKVDDGVQQYTYDKKQLINPLYNKPFDHNFEFKGKDVGVEIIGVYASGEYFVEEDANGVTLLELVTTDGKGRLTRFLEKGSSLSLGTLPVSYNADNNTKTALNINDSDSGLVFRIPFTVSYMSMDDRSTGQLEADKVHLFKQRHLYTIGGVKLVLKQIHAKAKVMARTGNEEIPTDILKIEIRVDDLKQEFFIEGGKGFVSAPYTTELDGFNFSIGYGAKYLQLPFSIALVDFQLDRYPGSNSPASYASEVILIDDRNNVKEEHRIYMNNILDYDGFRFFQSSYDKDERGTILSVNHDNLGTMVTYLGYLLMGIGMFFTLFVKGTRYERLGKILKDIKAKAGLIIIGVSVASIGFAQDNEHNHELDEIEKYAFQIDFDHAEAFGKILVQDHGGRIKPLNSSASEILRKLTRKESFEGLTASQVYLSIMVYPEYWQTVPMIKVSHDALKKELGIEGKYTSFLNVFDDQFRYKLGEKLEEVNRKKQVDRSKYDKDLLAVDERVNINYMLYTGSMLKIFPDSADINNKWYSHIADPFPFRGEDSLFVRSIIGMYITAVESATHSGDWSEANKVLEYISIYQNRFGKDVIPSEGKIKMEVFYNGAQIFKRLFQFYGLISFILLIVLFVNVFKDKKGKGWLTKGLQALIFGGFIVHAIGLAIRWYISGHAPWSNAYESMIFIAWTTVLAGIIYSRKSPISLAVTGILASLILMVAHLNWMDPEITNLVPVLNSYWLMIHVAIITSSYGFLGLSALLGFLNLMLMITKNAKNELRVKNTLKELTTINEMTVQVGLFLLTIGTFLGGVWANESWGRYWGWDAKETWALVTVLVYVFVAHMRFIKGLKSQYAYNVATMVAYLSVLMTYFGVNYYLSGLHSYAAGDPFPVPTFVYYILAIMLTIILLARYRVKKIKPREVNK